MIHIQRLSMSVRKWSLVTHWPSGSGENTVNSIQNEMWTKINPDANTTQTTTMLSNLILGSTHSKLKMQV